MSDQIECDGCGRSFTTDDPHGMIAAITGPCPSCGGTFRLVQSVGAVAWQDAPRRRASG
jgi:rRNA maturation endonuclease Nob1